MVIKSFIELAIERLQSSDWKITRFRLINRSSISHQDIGFGFNGGLGFKSSLCVVYLVIILGRMNQNLGLSAN